jgi:hypothetical protein
MSCAVRSIQMKRTILTSAVVLLIIGVLATVLLTSGGL